MFDNFWQYLLYTVWLYGMGIMLGYILWAPSTPFKRGLMDGFTFGPVRRAFQKLFK